MTKTARTKDHIYSIKLSEVCANDRGASVRLLKYPSLAFYGPLCLCGITGVLAWDPCFLRAPVPFARGSNPWNYARSDDDDGGIFAPMMMMMECSDRPQ